MRFADPNGLFLVHFDLFTSTVAPSHHPKNGAMHISRADRFKDFPPPSIVDVSVFPREGGQIQNRSGTSVAFINWFVGNW